MLRDKISAIPLSFGLMLYPSLVLEVVFDGAESTYYGFPLPWNSRSLVTSLAKDIYLLPLLVDILFYIILGYVIWRYFAKLIQNRGKALKMTALVFIWLYGISSIVFMYGVTSFGSFFALWYQDEFKIVNVLLGFNV